MKRCAIYLILSVGLVAFGPVGVAQEKIVKIGLVSFQGPQLASQLKNFHDGMKALGHVEGKTYELESHFTSGDEAKAKHLVRELVTKPVDIFIARDTAVAHMAKEATKTVPIVMLVSDPLATGLVPSLSRPGGNMTGTGMFGPDLAGKRIEILRDVRPSIRTIGFVGLSTDQNAANFARETRVATDRTNIRLLAKFIANSAELDEALFADLKREGAEAVIVQPIFTGLRDRVVSLAMRSQLPVISDYRPFAEAGALLTFGVDQDERVHRLAYFVDRILKGANPADLPVEMPSAFKLVVNTKTAKAVGWNIPESFLTRADEVIE